MPVAVVAVLCRVRDRVDAERVLSFSPIFSYFLCSASPAMLRRLHARLGPVLPRRAPAVPAVLAARRECRARHDGLRADACLIGEIPDGQTTESGLPLGPSRSHISLSRTPRSFVRTDRDLSLVIQLSASLAQCPTILTTKITITPATSPSRYVPPPRTVASTHALTRAFPGRRHGL